VLGALVVGLVWLFIGSDPPKPDPQPEPRHEPELLAGAVSTGEELTRKLNDPKTTELALGPGTFDLSAALQNKRSELAVSTSGPTKLILASPPGPEPKRILSGEDGAVWGLAFLGTDRLVMGLENGTVKIWNLSTGQAVKTLKRQKSTVWTVDVSADGKYMVTACDDSSVLFWDLAKLDEPKYSFPQQTSTRAAVFSPVGTYLATGDRGSTVRVWDWDLLVPVELNGHSGAVYALAYSPDGTRLASAGSDGIVRVWNMKEINWEKREGPDRPMELSEHHGSVYAVAFSPDGKKIATGGWDGYVRLWDAANGNQLREIKVLPFDVWSVSFGNGGKWVASAGSDGYVKVWEVETGKEVFSYHGANAFHVVRFAADGTTLAAGSRDGTVRVWEVRK
jgi:WD40 repeat protein